MRHWSLPLAGLLVLPLVQGQPLPAKEPTSASQIEIDKLIAQLGDGEYRRRERAQAELSELGAAAFDALAAAQGHQDLEIATRARFLLGRIRIELGRRDDPTAVRQLLKYYASEDEEQRQERIEKLAELAGSQGLDALCRLARYERSEVLSKRAAIEIITQSPQPKADGAVRAQMILLALGPSRRAASAWLRAYADAIRGQSQAAANAWAQFTSREAETLRRSPQQTHVDVVVELLKYRVRLLAELKRQEESLAAFRQLFDHHPTATPQVVKLITWVRQHETWAALDEVERRFAQRLRSDILLLYALATARDAQGKTQLAEQLAGRALAINPQDAMAHFGAARTLEHQGMFKWAEREYRHVIGLPTPAGQDPRLLSRFYLAGMLHDQEINDKAADVIGDAVAVLRKRAKEGGDPTAYQRNIKSLSGRMHYYFAMHHRKANQLDKHVEHLDKALEFDPTEADVLIAMYRLPQRDKKRQAKTLKAIEAAVEEFRKQVKDNPDDPTPYNQLAWLVGNTEGDYQEALRYSKRSLELDANSSAYLDTLGRCYYAVRDYQNAVKYQRMAVELQPHSGTMRRQLQLFEKAAAEAGGKP